MSKVNPRYEIRLDVLNGASVLRIWDYAESKFLTLFGKEFRAALCNHQAVKAANELLHALNTTDKDN